MMQRKREYSRWIVSKELKDTTFVEELPENERGKPYIITPLGSRIKRILFAGVVSYKNVEDNLTKITVADSAGSFYTSTFRNEYQPDLKDKADSIEVGSSILVMGRISTFKTDDGVLYININPEMFGSASPECLAYWSSRTALAARRKILAAREAKKLETPDRNALMAMGYSEDEADCAIRHLEHYKSYDLNGFMDVITSLPKGMESNVAVSASKDLVLEFIRSHADPEKGTRYEDIIAHMKDKNVDPADVDEMLNVLGSDGEIYEVSLKRYKAI